MKKLAIAALVAGVGGGAWAQASLTGTVAYGYQQTNAATGALASGFGVDTSELYWNAAEDLGSGHKIDAKLGLSQVDRGGVAGGDLEMKYTNPSVGLFSMGYTKAADYFAGDIASAGAPVINMDGKLHETRSSGTEWVSYAAPVGPVYLQVKHTENSAGKGLGAGGAGSATVVVQRNNQLSVYYPGSKLTVAGAWVVYDGRRDGDPMTLAGIGEYVAATKNQVINLQASYDFGVAKVGAGVQQADATNGVRVLDGILSFAVPAGAWTFGGAASISTLSGARATLSPTLDGSRYNGTASGMSLGAQYNLSKRTNVTMKYAAWTHSGYSQYEADAATGGGGLWTVGAAGRGYDRKANETSVVLSHSF
ncbi:MAG: porin [Rhodoferax sp.]